MKKFVRILLFVSLSIYVSAVVMAQDMQSFEKKAEAVVRSEEPTWKLIRKEERQKEVTYLWGPKGADLELLIFYGSSELEAAAYMKAQLSLLSVGPGPVLKNFGDEAFHWKNEVDNSAGIRFRKANVFIEISGPSESVVTDLAKKLAEYLPDK